MNKLSIEGLSTIATIMMAYVKPTDKAKYRLINRGFNKAVVSEARRKNRELAKYSPLESIQNCKTWVFESKNYQSLFVSDGLYTSLTALFGDVKLDSAYMIEGKRLKRFVNGHWKPELIIIRPPPSFEEMIYVDTNSYFPITFYGVFTSRDPKNMKVAGLRLLMFRLKIPKTSKDNKAELIRKAYQHYKL